MSKKKTPPRGTKYITEKFRQAHPGLVEDGAPMPVPDVANAVALVALKKAKAPKAKAPKKAAKTPVTLLLAPEWVEYIDALAESQCRTREGQALWIIIQAITAAKGGE